MVHTNLRLLRIGTHLLGGTLQTALLFPFLPPRRRDDLKQRWSGRLLELLRISVVPPDPDLERITHGLLVANHVSFIDIFAINAVLPSGFVAKSDVASWPLVGWLARHNETVFIQRGKPKAAHQTQQHMLAVLAAGRRLAVFPEGTTTAGDRVLPFHAALFQSAIDAAAPVHAISIAYQLADGRPTAAPAYIDDISLLACLRSIIDTDGIRVRLLLAASYAPPLPDRRHLAHRAHQAVATALVRGEAQGVAQPSRNVVAIST